MKRLFFVLFVSSSTGCAWSAKITAPDGTVYQGRAAVQVYAHQLQQDQLARRWDWLTTESQRPIKNEADAIGRNMLMQAIVLNGVQGSGGGEYFQYLASRNDMWARIVTAGISVLGPAVIAELLYDGGRGSTEISESISIGGDVVMSNSGSGGIGDAGFAGPDVIPEDSRAAAGQHRNMSLGGIGNQVGTLESTNAFYRSISGLNRRSGQLNQGSTEKPNSFLDNDCRGAGPCQDDRDDVRSDIGLFQ